MVNNNLCGTFNMTTAVANACMIPQKNGCIINMIANIYRGFPGMAMTKLSPIRPIIVGRPGLTRTP